MLPESVTKNKEARIAVLNHVAQSIVEELLEQHSVSVFIRVSSKGKRGCLTRMTDSGWNGGAKTHDLSLRQQKKPMRGASGSFVYTIFATRSAAG